MHRHCARRHARECTRAALFRGLYDPRGGDYSRGMDVGRVVEFPRGVLLALIIMGSLMGGCAGSGPPRHYKDPHAMIDVFEGEDRDTWQMPDRVVAVLPIAAKNSVIADIGAGSGYFTRRLAFLVPEGRVYAVDVDGEFEGHLLARREDWGTPHIQPLLAQYDDPELPAKTLDLVFTANTFAYIRDREAYFGKVREALKAGGHLAIIDFRPGATVPKEGMASEPQFRVSAEAARAEIERAGFVLEREETFLPYQWFLIFRRTP